MPANGSIFKGPEVAQLYNASKWKYFYRPPEIAQLYNASGWKYFYRARDSATVECQQIEVFSQGWKEHNCTCQQMEVFLQSLR